MEDGELLRFTEAARVLGCSVGNVYALKEAGLIQVISTGAKGKGFRVRASELERFLRRSDAASVATAPSEEGAEGSALGSNAQGIRAAHLEGATRTGESSPAANR